MLTVKTKPDPVVTTKIGGPRPCLDGARVKLQVAAMALAGVSAMGWVLAFLVDAWGYGRAGDLSSNNVFYYLFVHFEQWALALATAIFLSLRVIFQSPGKSGRAVMAAWYLHKMTVPAVSALVLVVTSVGTFIVCFNHPLAMDEFFSDFQAEIFSRGRMFGAVPENLWPVENAATPLATWYHRASHLWIASYLPVYSLLRTPLFIAGLSWLLNPLLAAGSILLAAACARRIWPDSRTAPAVAALLLGTSAQFLVTSMTAYAMAGHLFVNLLWLRIYLSRRSKAFLWLPLIGFLAVGMHQPHIHLLFAAPFVLSELLKRRWARFFALSGCYAGTVAAWAGYMKMRDAPGLLDLPASALKSSAGGGLLSLFSLPGSTEMLTQAVNFPMIWSWQSIALCLFSIVAMISWKELTAPLPELLGGAVLALGFYFFFPSNQGHGWGYRYFYIGLIPLTLLSVAGWELLVRSQAKRTCYRLMSFSLLFAVCVQIPLRCLEVRSFSKPFAETTRWLESIPARFVVIPTHYFWYGQDLVRNRPFADNRPVLLFASRMTPPAIEFLQHSGQAALVQPGDLLERGLSLRTAPPEEKTDE